MSNVDAMGVLPMAVGARVNPGAVARHRVVAAAVATRAHLRAAQATDAVAEPVVEVKAGVLEIEIEAAATSNGATEAVDAIEVVARNAALIVVADVITDAVTNVVGIAAVGVTEVGEHLDVVKATVMVSVAAGPADCEATVGQPRRRPVHVAGEVWPVGERHA